MAEVFLTIMRGKPDLKRKATDILFHTNLAIIEKLKTLPEKLFISVWKGKGRHVKVLHFKMPNLKTSGNYSDNIMK